MIDTESNRLLWRDTSSAAATDLIGLREQISRRLRQRPLPAARAARPARPRPRRSRRTPEAYDLYLRSKPLTSDPEPNQQGIAMLERSVGLDPGFAPAWAALGIRYYYDVVYGGS